MPYVINENTIALLPLGKKTKIIEEDKEIISEKSINKIIDYNCNLNGSTFEGRRKASSYLIGATYKPPIILDEIKELILIPTHSSKNTNCVWFLSQNILKYHLNKDNKVTVIVKNGQTIDLNIGYTNFDKQVLRATRLETSLRSRKYKKHL